MDKSAWMISLKSTQLRNRLNMAEKSKNGNYTEEFAVSFCNDVKVRRFIPDTIPRNLQELSGYFDSIGYCEKRKLTFENVLDLKELYLVWYTLNSNGETGWDKKGSNNYTVADFVNDYHLGKLNVASYRHRICQLEGVIKKLRRGLNQPITITVGYHSKLKKNLVVDGVKRSIALYYLKLTDSELLEKIMSEYPVYILKFISEKCDKIFPKDFQKLTF
jgi:hypothetical protein